jgi:hypothetical protein
MRKLRTTIALVASLALAACQTLDGVRVNGVDLSDKRVTEAQGNFGFCEANPFVCILLGVGVVGGLILILSGDDDDGPGGGGGY